MSTCVSVGKCLCVCVHRKQEGGIKCLLPSFSLTF